MLRRVPEAPCAILLVTFTAFERLDTQAGCPLGQRHRKAQAGTSSAKNYYVRVKCHEANPNARIF